MNIFRIRWLNKLQAAGFKCSISPRRRSRCKSNRWFSIRRQRISVIGIAILQTRNQIQWRLVWTEPWLGEELAAFFRRSLKRKIPNAVHLNIKLVSPNQLPAFTSNVGKIVIWQRQVHELRQFADSRRNCPVKLVVRQVEVLHTSQASERLWNGAGQHIAAHVEYGGICQEADFIRQATWELVVQEKHF